MRIADLEAAQEKGRRDAKEWARRNPQRAAEFRKKSRQSAKERFPERERLRAVVSQQIRRSRLRGLQSPDRRVVSLVFAASGGKCAYCGRTDKMTLDHIRAISKGGNNDWDNLLGACHPCNASKGALEVADWLFERFGVDGLARALFAIKATKKAIQRLHPTVMR